MPIVPSPVSFTPSASVLWSCGNRACALGHTHQHIRAKHPPRPTLKIIVELVPMPRQSPRRPRQASYDSAGPKRRYGPGPIGRFSDDHWTPDCPMFTRFTFVKYFRQDPTEPPTPLIELIGSRFSPAPAYQASSPLADARRDFVLPRDAPRTIASIAEVIAAFDSIPPLPRQVMVELKFILRASTASHCAYEAVRGFALDYFARERGLAAVLVLHLPARSGATGDNHIHLFVPARRLTAEGFGTEVRGLAHDEGFREVSNAWSAWQQTSVSR